jgi:hypothetical protein
MPKCRACGASIEFVTTENGRKMPVNDRLQNFVVVTEDGTAYVRQGHTPHWATCTDPDAFRKPQSAQLSLLGGDGD